MKLQNHPSLIFRTPKFPSNAKLTECWPELKASIKISSLTFYEYIKDTEAKDLDSLPQKIQFTIWKYFNRAKYRATPYGTFAGFSFLTKDQISTQDQIIIKSEMILHEFIDWPVKNEIDLDRAELLKQNVQLFSNSSFYLTTESIRYIACTDGQFELAEIDHNDAVLKILKACLQPIKLNDLILSLQATGDEVEHTYALLYDMLSLQMLFSDRDPNIIGEDYFTRINKKFQYPTPKYIIAERKITSGSLDDNLLSALPNLISLVHQISPQNEKGAFKNFLNNFTKKFEQREIPLVIALDPEMGVGYGELEQGEQSDDFVSQLRNVKGTKATVNALDLLKKEIKDNFFVDDFDGEKTIFLDKIPLTNFSNDLKLPNTLSLMMSVVDDLLQIEQLGGTTANALNGRFTIASDEVYNYTKQIATIEKKANPNVLFFDIAYMVEANVDNINRRKLSYDYQLSILNFDTSENPLMLNDIMLSISNGELILRSKKHNKRLIPKIASAYNYIRSDLSAFRLFCDLQHQGVQSSLLLRLEQLFPEKDRYPRLQYKNIILSNAKWRINSKDFLKYVGKENQINLCKSYLQRLGVSRYFKTGNSDQTLTFNTDYEDDLIAFIQYMQKQISCYLEEVILPNKSIVIDESHQPYFAQFIVTLFHQQEIYKGLANLKDQDNVKSRRFFPPGSEWVYFEIFCHQQRSDSLLLNPISNFLSRHKSEIKSWFFIRYNEHGDHLRLRILLNDEQDGQKLIKSLSEHLKHELATGLVSDLMIKTYRREIERYGVGLIEDVEKLFFTDSNYVLSVLQVNTSVNDKYKLCANLAMKIQSEQALFATDSFNQMIKNISNTFNNEHSLETPEFKKLNAQYQLYRSDDFSVLEEEPLSNFDSLCRSFVEVLFKCKPENRFKLFGDLMHMHVNRLFNKDQRTHEMVMYYFLLKDLQRIAALSK